MKKILNTLTLLFLLNSLAACGTSNNTEGTLDSSSRAQDLNSAKPLALCNELKKDSFDVHVKSYVESSGIPRYDLIYMDVEDIPKIFDEDTAYLSIYRWKASSTSAPVLDSTPLKFAIYDMENGQYLTGSYSSLRWSDISALSASMKVYYPKDFFKKVKIIVDLQDTTGEYDAIKMVLHDNQTNKSKVQVDGLLPFFHADPSDYAVEADGSQRALALQKLHPFYSLKGQRSASEFSTMANDFCF